MEKRMHTYQITKVTDCRPTGEYIYAENRIEAGKIFRNNPEKYGKYYKEYFLKRVYLNR